MNSGFSAIVSGCYVAWSPTLAAIYSQRFPASDRTVVKIGRSRDIYARHENLNGRESRLSRGYYAVDRDGYAHVTDWILWRLTTVADADERILREKQLQDAHSRIGNWMWPNWHAQISQRRFVPAALELFVARPEVVQKQFFMAISRVPVTSNSSGEPSLRVP